MKNTLALLSIALAACGGGNHSDSTTVAPPDDSVAATYPCGDARNIADNNHGCGFAFDSQGPQGLKLRYDTTDFPLDAPGDSRFANPATYEVWFNELQQCAGLSAPMLPFVIILPEGSLSGVTRYQYFSAPFLVVLDTIGQQVAAIGHKKRFNHAAMHYLLHVAIGTPAGVTPPPSLEFQQGFTPPDQDHLSPLLFGDCVSAPTF